MKEYVANAVLLIGITATAFLIVVPPVLLNEARRTNRILEDQIHMVVAQIGRCGGDTNDVWLVNQAMLAGNTNALEMWTKARAKR